MKIHEFFRKYANVPMSLRITPLNFSKGGNMTLSDVHKRISQLEDQMQPLRIEEDKLLELAEPLLSRMK